MYIRSERCGARIGKIIKYPQIDSKQMTHEVVNIPYRYPIMLSRNDWGVHSPP